MADSKVTVFVVLADHGAMKDQRLGLFFRVLDADTFVSTLSSWSNARVEAEEMALTDVHPAHHAVPVVAAAFKASKAAKAS